MKIAKPRISIFIIASIIFCLLCFIAFLGAYAVDEGQTGIITQWFAKLFHVFLLPINYIFGEIDLTFLITALFVSCFIYGFITERIISFIYHNKK